MLEKQPDGTWELTIVDGVPPSAALGALAVGDVDGDGAREMVVGGSEGIFWYRPGTGECYKLSDDSVDVGMLLADIDGDGRAELVTSASVGKRWPAIWFKSGPDPRQPWRRHVICENSGNGHDMLLADVDEDGVDELVFTAIGRTNPRTVIYKPDGELSRPWRQHVVQQGIFAEGTSIGDVDGSGKLAIVVGPYLYRQPAGGPLAGPWERSVFAPGFREMNRTRLVDITGSGRPDVVIAESEFLDGRMSWFENRLLEDPANPWIEHKLDRGLYYLHSLQASRDPASGQVRIFAAEMAEGGWRAPRNYDARVMEYVTEDNGKTWRREMISIGTGTHEAEPCDIDGDGQVEIVGKQWHRPSVHFWKKSDTLSPLARFRHVMLDRDKPYMGTDILAVDVSGNGLQDVVCGAWWYENPTWRRRTIPGIYQVINAYDIDGDGRCELIATKKNPKADNAYRGLTSELVWLKAVDPLAGKWQEHPIGTGCGDWPHGSAVAPVLPGRKVALMTTYHSGQKHEHFPELFEVPDDPAEHPWPKRTLAEIVYGEELVPCDISGSGRGDLAAGECWLENLGDGTFKPHRIAEGFMAARLAVADIAGSGRCDIVLGEEALDFDKKVTPPSRLVWLECPEDPRGTWTQHGIDTIRCGHSISVADLDGDGQVEIVCGEHDPFYPYRTRCRLLVYKKADPQGRTWKRFQLDDRFEHHDGAKIIDLGGGRLGIISHGWKDFRYVHLWEPI